MREVLSNDQSGNKNIRSSNNNFTSSNQGTYDNEAQSPKFVV